MFPASPPTLLHFLSLQEISKEGSRLVGGPQDNYQVSGDGFKRRGGGVWGQNARGWGNKQKHQYLLASCSNSGSSDHQETRDGSGIPVSLVHPFSPFFKL